MLLLKIHRILVFRGVGICTVPHPRSLCLGLGDYFCLSSHANPASAKVSHHPQRNQHLPSSDMSSFSQTVPSQLSDADLCWWDISVDCPCPTLRLLSLHTHHSEIHPLRSSPGGLATFWIDLRKSVFLKIFPRHMILQLGDLNEERLNWKACSERAGKSTESWDQLGTPVRHSFLLPSG